MLKKNYIVKVNFEIPVEATNEDEAKMEFWNNVNGSQSTIENIVEESIEIIEEK